MYTEKGNIGNKSSEDITRYKIVRPDDIVVNSMNVIIGSVGLSKYTGCLSPVYYVLTRRFESDNPRYLNAYFQTKPFQESLVRIGNGILAHRMRIPMESLKCEVFPKPPAGTEEDVLAIARRLEGRKAPNTISNYKSAMRQYVAMVQALCLTAQPHSMSAAVQDLTDEKSVVPADAKTSSANEHYLYSSYREVLLEHLLSGEVMKHLWLRGNVRIETLKPQIDDAGYDLVLKDAETAV